MTEYAIWKPEHDGHAPPNWKEGMAWSAFGFINFGVRDPFWHESAEYHVPPEALNSPNDDAMPGAIQDALYVLRQYPADELAKHGITLAPEKDWATELADVLAHADKAAWPTLIRERVVLKGEG